MDRNTDIVELSADQLDQVSGGGGLDGISRLANVTHIKADDDAMERLTSQAQKRLETQRKDLTRNWAG